MNRNNILVYVLAAITISTAIIYFILAYNEYTSLIEFAAEGLDGEISELQIEIALFAGSGIIYLGLVGWILVNKLKNIVSYSILIGVSTILIITYAASRTIGVPIIGVEFYIGKYDILTKVLQGIIIAVSGYLVYRIATLKKSRTQEKNLKNKSKT
ncbi:MAG TPA: hypothetical protein VFV86_05470 [Nitrososphaeraceae archaeon]|nr:hypothetical protein [Nitrososphaeraceae archaeon]